MSLWLWAAVAGAGGVAAVLRFAVDTAVSERLGRQFPFGTLTVNLSGAFVLGVLTGAALAPNVALVAGTATVGTYTTFSTWMLESQRLTEDGDARSAVVNLVASTVVGAAAAALGRTIGLHL